MVSLQSSLFLKTHPSSLNIPPPFSLIKNHSKPSLISSGFGLDNACEVVKRKGSKLCSQNGSVGRDSEFEVDPDKAREALRKLDQQLRSLSEKPINTPKIRATELDLTRKQSEFDGATEQASVGLPEGSLQAIAVLVLLTFTIFYNVIFITVIKPSIDGPEIDTATLSLTEAPETPRLQQVPPAPGI